MSKIELTELERDTVLSMCQTALQQFDELRMTSKERNELQSFTDTVRSVISKLEAASE